MSDSNTTALAGLAKQVYDDYVERQQNLKTHTIDKFGKSAKKYNPGGAGFYGAINDYGNESVGAINEEEQFRTIDSEHYVQWVVKPKINVAPIQFSGLASKALESDEQAFASAIVDALDLARLRLKKDENRQFFGYGNGVLGQASATVASAATSFTVLSAQYFRANQVVDIYNTAGGTAQISALRIADVDKVNSVLIFAAAVAQTINTAYVIAKQNVLGNTPPADGKEMMGLRGIVDDGTDLTTFQNITVAATTNNIWKGIRTNASSANVTSDSLQRLIDDVQVLGGDAPDTLIMHTLQRRKYLDLVVPQKRYMDGKMDSGFSELTFNGMELNLDEDCQYDTVYAITKSMIRQFELAPIAMGAHDGSDVFLRLANYDQFQAYWRHYANMGTSKRAAHGKLVSLAVPSGVS